MGKLAITGGAKVLTDGINVTWPQFDDLDEQALLNAFRSGNWWRGGTIEAQAESQCGRFERDFAAFQDSPFGLCVSNGTVAVELALRAAGIEHGDEVIVPALSFVVSASAVLPLGAIPIFADCDPETYQPDPDAIEAAITPKTRAVIIVHFGGYPADLDRIVSICERHNLPLIEDCAHAQGSQWRGKGVGSYGLYGTFSFQQFKSLPVGEGGIVLSSKEEAWQAAYTYHNLGRLEHAGFYDFHRMASNLRMTDLQGAILNTQFAKLKDKIPVRMAAAKRLGTGFADVGGLRPLPADERITRRGYYYYLLHYDRNAFCGASRETFLEALRAEGVGFAGRGYGQAIHKNPLFQELKVGSEHPNADYKNLRCPVAERVTSEELVTLHHPALLATNVELDGIVEAVAKIKRHADELA